LGNENSQARKKELFNRIGTWQSSSLHKKTIQQYPICKQTTIYSGLRSNICVLKGRLKIASETELIVEITPRKPLRKFL